MVPSRRADGLAGFSEGHPVAVTACGSIQRVPDMYGLDEATWSAPRAGARPARPSVGGTRPRSPFGSRPLCTRRTSPSTCVAFERQSRRLGRRLGHAWCTLDQLAWPTSRGCDAAGWSMSASLGPGVPVRSSREQMEALDPGRWPTNEDQHSPWGYAWVLCASVTTIVVAVFAWNYYAGTTVAWFRAQSSDGVVIEVHYSSGACDDGAAADVEESSTTVTVTVRTRNFPDGSCSDAKVARTVEISLDEPLGDRLLIDGACVMRQFEGLGTCSAGGVRVLEDH